MTPPIHVGLAQCQNGQGAWSLTDAHKILTKLSHVKKILYNIYC